MGTNGLNLWVTRKGTGSLERGTLKSTGMRVNVRKTNIMISSENIGKVTEKDKFPWAVSRKGVGSKSILYHF